MHMLECQPPIQVLAELEVGRAASDPLRAGAPIGRAPVLLRCGVGVGRRNGRLHRWGCTPPRKIRRQFYRYKHTLLVSIGRGIFVSSALLDQKTKLVTFVVTFGRR
jgi:hypothetical protein